MKPTIHLFLSAFLFFATACVNELDNYEAPDAGVYGSIIDAQTNEPVPLPVQGSNGVIIRMLEIGTGATKTVDFYAMEDGSFKNSMLFDCDYQISVEGAFAAPAKVTASVKGQTEVNIPVTPLARIEASASITGKVITLTYKVQKTDAAYTTAEVYGYWHLAPRVDDTGSNSSGKEVVTVTGDSDLSGSISFNLDKEDAFNKNLYKIKSNGNKIYLRIGAKTEGKINYSKTLLVTVG